MLFADPARLRGLPEAIETALDGPSPLFCVLFNPFGTLLASGCANGDVSVWNWATRGVARIYSGGHSDAVTALLWSSDGRQLLSTSKDGIAVIWDVLSGSQLKKVDLSGVTAVSAPAAALPTDLASARLLISYEIGAAEEVVLNDVESRKVVPVAALDGDGRGARLLTGEAAESRGALAAYSPCGSYVVSAGRGVLCLLRASDLAVLDVVKLMGVPDRVTSLRFDRMGSKLAITATDRFLRVYDVPPPLNSSGGGEKSGNDAKPKKKRAKVEDSVTKLDIVDLATLAALPADKIPKQGSLLPPVPPADPAAAAASSTPPPPRLRLSRLFESQVERAGWGAAAFSPDGTHVVSSLASTNEQVIYTWNIPHGFAANTLQAGSDTAIALEWHLDDPPAQLLALGASGRLYVWAKVLTQDWSAFAPDFETLADNREHEEEEEEFDVFPPRPVPAHPTAEAGGASKDGQEDADVDIVEWEWVEKEGGSLEGVWRPGWEAAVAEGRGPLTHLPVVWPSEAVPEEKRKVYEELNGRKGGAEKEEEGEEGGSGGKAMEVEKSGEPEANGNGEEGEEAAAKKARNE